MSELSVFAISAKQVLRIDLNGLTPIGGAHGSGVLLKDLSATDDYAVLIRGETGQILVHPLKGSAKGPITLTNLEPLVLQDLTLICLPDRQMSDSKSADSAINGTGSSPFEGSTLRLLQAFAKQDDLSVAMAEVLKLMHERFSFERGLLITRDLQGDFTTIAANGVKPDDSWMSESLILDVLKTKKPAIIQNIFGSGYDSNKSLIATGFMSVFAWPLMVRGEALGILVAGSVRPHSGLGELQLRQAEIFVQLSALMLQTHLRERQVRAELESMRDANSRQDGPMLTHHEPLLDTCRLAKQVAPTDLSVLIQGETGVGKELLANWIHKNSDRKQKPFVAVNCGAIPSDLLESLLFGHKKGSFTGAANDQVGKFQMADGGTLFLDEIGDLPEILQVKLLRVLQEKVVEPIGSVRPVPIDVRVIAASHKDLPGLIRTGKFREDLYYRLAEVTLMIPSLRERPEDIGLLAAFFLRKFAPEKRFAESGWEWLRSQKLSGNVRELMSAVKRASILSQNVEIVREDFSRGLPTNNASGKSNASGADGSSWLGGQNLEEAKNRFLQEKVKEALLRSQGKRAKAAELLGVTPRTLFRYLEEFRKDMVDVSYDSDSDVSADI